MSRPNKYQLVNRQRRYPVSKRPRRKVTNYNGNIHFNCNKIHTKGNDVTCLVKREVRVTDSHGNSKIAREQQIFTSWKKAGSIFSDF